LEVDLKLPGLLRSFGVGGGERPAGVKSKFSISKAVLDRRENILLLEDRSGEFSMLASSLATWAADNMGCGVYSDLDRVELLVTGDPGSSQNEDCGAAFGDARGFRWELGSERRLKTDRESSFVIVVV
jgi:hypothetical protein